MFPSLSRFTVCLCAFAVLCTATGCASGLFGKLSVTSVDPFLEEEPVELVARGEQAVDAASSRIDTELSALSERPELVSPNEVAFDFQGEGELATAMKDSLAEVESAVDPTLFEDLPGAGSGIQQAGFQSELPQDAVVQAAPTVNSGLGSATPWGGSTPSVESQVQLSFDDGDGTTLPPPPQGESDFPINLDEFSRDALQTPVYQVPMEDEPPAAPMSGSKAEPSGKFDLPGNLDNRLRDAATETFDAFDQRVKSDRKSIRDRFSELGARFGIGGGEDESPVPAPAINVAPQSKGDCLEDLISTTQARLADANYSKLSDTDRDQYLRDHVNLRLFYLANEQNERALDAIPGIPPAEQEFWQQMFWSLTQYRNSDAIPDRTERITQTVDQLRVALHRLQENAKLQLSNVSFCKRIVGYGNYERFERDAFKPGAPVLVYAEIDNFKSEPTATGQHRTLMRSTLQILPEGGVGKPLDSVTLKAVEDVCRNPRRDYFNSYEFTIPNDIAPGRYVLELTIDDQLSGKSTRKAVLFTVN